MHLPLKKKKQNLLTGIQLHLHLTKRHPFKSGLHLTGTFLFKYSFYHENISYKHTNVKTCEVGLPTLVILWLEHLIASSFGTDISPRGKKQLQ